MHFWNFKKLAKELREYNVGSIETLMYALINAMLYWIGFSVFTWLPLFYYFSFSWIKIYLEKQAEPAPLHVVVFNHLDYFFLTLKIIILLFGIAYCLLATKRLHLYSNLKRLICLSVPINIRFNIIATVILALILLACCLYFGGQLLKLAEQEPSLKTYIGKFLAKISPARLIKYGLSQWENFKKAKIIFDDINLVSYIFYLICQVTSLIMSAALFFIIATSGTSYKK